MHARHLVVARIVVAHCVRLGDYVLCELSQTMKLDCA